MTAVTPAPGPELPTDPEDVKIIALARSALVRTQAREGACLRDSDGRTYAATSIDLPHLQLSAVVVAVAMAVSSGAGGLEAVALAAADRPREADLDVLRDLPGQQAVLWHVDQRGEVQHRVGLHGPR